MLVWIFLLEATDINCHRATTGAAALLPTAVVRAAGAQGVKIQLQQRAGMCKVICLSQLMA